MSEIDLIAIVDTETSGLDPEEDRVLEIGIVVWSLTEMAMISARSLLVYTGDPIPEEAERVHKITPELAAYGMIRDDAANAYHDEIRDAQAIVEYSGTEFDRGFLRAFGAPSVPWIDTYHCDWPEWSSSRSLVSVAIAHGVAVTGAHRALADCLLLARLLRRVRSFGVDPRSLLEHAARPRLTYRALVSYDDRQLAKDHGCRWDAERRWWVGSCAVVDADALPYMIDMVTP